MHKLKASEKENNALFPFFNRCGFLHIELVATDGKIQKRILWVAVTSNGVYSGHCHEKRDVHISYHFDGNVYHNWFGEKPKKTRTLASLEDLKDYFQLYSTGFTSDLSRLHHTPSYHLKKLDAIVNVDTRVYPKGIGCNVFIIAKDRFDLIGKVVNGLPQPLTTEAHLFLRCAPWIALVLYGGLYTESQI